MYSASLKKNYNKICTLTSARKKRKVLPPNTSMKFDGC